MDSSRQKIKNVNFSLLKDNNPIFWNFSLDKVRLKNFVSWFFKNHGEKKTLQLLEQLKNLGFGYATQAGISLGIEDLKIPPNKNKLLAEAENSISNSLISYRKGEITGIEKRQQFIETWHEISENLKQEVVRYFEKTNILNPVYMMAFSGARGNLSQVRQLVGMRGLMSDPQGKIIEFPIQSNFREGLTLTEYLISTYGARKGIVDTALRTATAGYLTRRLVDVAQHVIVSTFDCGTKRGIFLFDMKEGNKTIYSFSNRLIGRVLAQNIYASVNVNQLLKTEASKSKLGFRNQEINTELATAIAKLHKKALVRSPLTCETRKLVCQLCYGWSLATSRLVSVGEAVGVIAGQSIGEPGTQLTMRTFHTGGVFSGEITEQINAPFSGIAEYSEPISGACIRTPLGFLAFLTKTNGTLFFKKSKMKLLEDDSLHLNKTLTNESSVMNVYKIPSFTVLFARHGEFIEKSKFLAQISLFPTGQKTTQTIEQTIYSSLEGEVYYNQIDLLEDIDEKYGEHISKAEDWSKVWVLSAKISNNTLVSDYLPKCGDFVSKNSIVNQIQWLTNFSQPSYINYNTSNASNFKNSDYSYESKRLFKSFQSYSLSNNKLKSNLTLNSSFNAVLALKTKSIDNFSSNFKIFSKYQKRKKFLLNNINLTNLNQRQIFSVYYLRNIQTCFVYPYQFNFRYNFLKSIAQTVIFLPILGSGVLTNWLNLKSLKHKKNKKQKVMNLVQKQSTVLVKRLNLNKKFKVRHNVVMRGQASRPGGALPPGPQKSPRSGGQGPPQSPRPNGSGGSPRALGPGGGPPRALNKTNFFHPLILANFVSFSSTLNTKTLKNFYKRKSKISNVKLEKSIVYPYFPNNYPNPLSEYNYLNKSDTDFWLYKKSMENVFNKFSFKNQAQLKNLQNSKQKKHHGSSIITKFEKNKIRNIFFKKTTTLKREQLSIKTPILFLNTEKICYRKLGYFVSIEIEPNKRDQLFSFLPLQNDSSMDIHKIHILNKSLGFSSFLSLKKNLKNTKLKNPNANNTLNLNNTDSWSLNSNQGFYWFPEFSQTITNGIFSVLGPTISQKIFKTKFFKLKTKNTKSAFFYTKKYIQFLNLAQSQITKKNLTNKMNFSKTFRKKKFSKFLKNQEKNKGTIFQSVLFSNLANINLAYHSETKDVRFTNKNFYLSHFNQDSFSKKLQLIFMNIENYQMFHFVSPLNKYPWFEKKSHEKAFNYLKTLNHKSLKQQLKSNYISVKKSFIIDNFKQTEKKDSKKSSERKIFSFSKKDLEYSKNLTVKLNQFKKLSTPFQEIYWLAQENYSLNVLINNNKLKNFGLNESRFIFNSNHTNFNRIKERTNIYLTNYQGLKKEFVFKYDGLLKIHTSEVLNTFNKNGQLDKPVNLNFTKSSSLAHSKLKVKFIKYVLMKKNFKRNLFLNTQTQQNLHKSKVNGLFCVNLKNYNNFLSSLPLLQRTNISTRSPENFTTVKNFAKKKYSKKISKTKNLALNITLKPGWIYKTTNLSNIFNIHKLLISAGNNLLDDICFEQQNIFVEIISLNKMCLPNLFKTDFKNQKSTNSFNTLIKVKNSKCRFLQKNKDIKQKHQKNLLKFGGTNGRWGPRGGETPPQALRFIKPKRTPSASRSPRKLRDVTALFFLIRPLNHRLFPNHQQMKRALYKCMQKKRTNELNSSNFLYKKYFSNELNQQTNALKSLSNFEPLDFQLTRMNLWDSTFVSKKQKFLLFNSKKLNPKQKIEETPKKTSFSTLFPNSFFKSFSKKGQVFYLAKKISNFFSNSSNFRKYERGRNCILEKAYFSNYSVNFTQCKVSLSLSRSSIANASTTAAGFLAYSFPQISLNKEPTRMDFSEYSSTEYNNYLKNQYLRILMIRSSHSLFQKNNAFFSKTQKFSEVSNSLEKSRFRFYKKRIINLQSFLNFYNSMPFFEYSLNQKYGFLANQKLFASSFYKQQFENYFKITVLDSKTIFNETFNGKRFIQKKRNKNVVSDFSRNFPISKNHLILKKNFLKNTMSLGLTSFYSPYEGEVLKIYNQNSDILNLRKSVNVYLETGLEQERQQQKLILTKSDIFGLELPITKVSFLDLKKPLQSPVRFFDSMWGSKQSSNVVLSVPSSESSIWRKIDFFRSFFRTVDSWKNSREWHPLNRGHEKTNFSKTYKPEIFNFNHLEDQTFFNLISTKNSLKFLLFYHERFKRLEKHYYDEFDLNQYKISDFNTHYKNKRYKIKTVSFDLINQNKKLRLGAFVSTGEKFYSNLTFLKSGLIIHLSSKKLTLRKAQFFFISPQAILHTYHGHCLTKNSPVMTLPFQTLKTGDIVQGIPKVEQYLEARTTIRGRLFLNSLPVLLYAIYQRYSSQLNMEKAVQQSFLKIQQILVDGVQRVYRSQGVSIADKHLEIIVRQMTSKVKIVYGGQTGFFPGEFVDLEFVERINRFLMVKIRYEPVVLGITRASLEVDSFLSAASFQQTTKVLSRAAMENKKDFLKGLKENLLVGNLLPAGTGYIVPISEKRFSKILIDD